MPSSKNNLLLKEKEFENSLQQVGKKLIQLRIEKGYKSHETFALDFDLPRVQYWRLEKGRVNFTLRSLQKILNIHKLTIEEFFSKVHED